MDMKSDFSFSKMKENIANAGNYFYQYRACKRDAATIYDIGHFFEFVKRLLGW